MDKRFLVRPLGVSAFIAAAVLFAVPVWAQADKPNILVIWGDDVGQSNISAYTMGNFLATFEEFPPRQKPGTFTIGDAKDKIFGQMDSK